jgi:ABC-type nitrate/sulfonate/bicarbonate transport system substrate-binding protein
MIWHRRETEIFATTLVSLACWFFFHPLSPSPAPAWALEPVTVSYPGPSPFYIPVEVARRKGFFREQQLDVRLIVTKSDVDRAALATGDINFTLRVSSTVLSAARGLPVRVLLVGTTKPFWALVVRQDINVVKDLKGKAIGVGGLVGAHHLTTRVILRQHGLNPERDVVFKVVGVGARLPALLSGAMDGGLLDYAEAFRAKKAGLKILLNAADYHSILSAGLGANMKTLREKSEQVRRFIKANVDGLKAMRVERDLTLKVITDWMKVDPEMAEGIYQLSVNNFTDDGLADEAMLKTLIDEQLAEAKVTAVPVSEVFDFSFLRQVLKERR